MSYKPKRQVCVYVLAEVGTDNVAKLGMTELLARRFASIQSSNWRELRIAAAFQVETWEIAQEIELQVSTIFADRSIRGEWFRERPERIKAAIEGVLRVFALPVLDMVENQESNVIKLEDRNEERMGR